LTREDNHANGGIESRVPQGIADLVIRGGRKGIAHMGTVDRDLRNPFGLVVEDFAVVPGDGPFNGCHEISFLKKRRARNNAHRPSRL
jgi:hypothetical protein